MEQCVRDAILALCMNVVDLGDSFSHNDEEGHQLHPSASRSDVAQLRRGVRGSID